MMMTANTTPTAQIVYDTTAPIITSTTAYVTGPIVNTSPFARPTTWDKVCVPPTLDL
jgi:hypothetical protein